MKPAAQTANGHVIAMALRKAYLSMHRQADATLQPHGVTANQFVVLAVLAKDDGITQRELGDRASSDPNTIRPILAALEKKRYVTREAHPGDRRAWRVVLTPAGRAAFEQISAGSEAFREDLTAPFSKTEAQMLVNLLGRVTDAMCQRDPSLQRKRTRAQRLKILK